MSNLVPPQPTADPVWILLRLYRMSAERYEAMAASGPIPTSHRIHFISGYLMETMTRKPPHVVADDLGGRELARVLPGWYIREAKPIRLPGQASEPEPDRCVVRGTILDDTERHPGHDDIALLVELAYASPADDRELAAEVYVPAGIPVCWIVDLNGRRVEVDTTPVPRGYGPPAIVAEGRSVPVVIDWWEAGRIGVADILPPTRPRAEAGGDGA